MAWASLFTVTLLSSLADPSTEVGERQNSWGSEVPHLFFSQSAFFTLVFLLELHNFMLVLPFSCP